jgi:hypothetical protein
MRRRRKFYKQSSGRVRGFDPEAGFATFNGRFTTICGRDREKLFEELATHARRFVRRCNWSIWIAAAKSGHRHGRRWHPP